MTQATAFNRKEHWEAVYRTKSPVEMSWYQNRPVTSLGLIEAAEVGRNEPIIDVGGGASTLVDHLLDAGFTDVSVMDVSAAALEHAKRRLGDRAALVKWVEQDVTKFKQSSGRFALWHDRAVFHFLVDVEDRKAYVQGMKGALKPGGQAIIATFALDGPAKCSGLNVARYGAAQIAAELGDAFELIDAIDETHMTPWNAPQRFCYFRFRRSG
ncbi:MAG: class I SAM-dependent methyltransferase [Phycisphaerales bacterium]|nr:class I SAM-dependent methyltransferase [Phycisphaerales bacterium]